MLMINSAEDLFQIIHLKLQDQKLPLKNVFLLVIDCNYIKKNVFESCRRLQAQAEKDRDE